MTSIPNPIDMNYNLAYILRQIGWDLFFQYLKIDNTKYRSNIKLLSNPFDHESSYIGNLENVLSAKKIIEYYKKKFSLGS